MSPQSISINRFEGVSPCFNFSRDLIKINKTNSNYLSTQMFWNYFFTSDLAHPSYVLLLPYSCESVPGNPESKTSLEFPPQNLSLTAQDHKKAGYQKNKTPWTESEDNKLRSLRDEKNWEWEEIAKQLPGRNPKMCYSRYKRLEYNPREHWREAQNELLKELVKRHNEEWQKICCFFPSRSLKQIKDHYQNYLRESINKEIWTLEEDMKLVDLLNTHGRNWRLIENQMNGRTQNQIKNRYFGRIKKLNDRKEAEREESVAQE